MKVPVSKMRRTAVKIEKSRSHLDFISLCLEEGLVPKGFSIQWRSHIDSGGVIDDILRRTEREIMGTCKQLLVDKIRGLERDFSAMSDQVRDNGTDEDVERARVWVERDREATKREMARTKQSKLNRLKGACEALRKDSTRADYQRPAREGTRGVQREPEGSDIAGHLVRRHMISRNADGVGDTAEREKEDNVARVVEPGQPASPEGTSADVHDHSRVEVVNLSSRRLTESELSLLGKGLTFVPAKRQTVAQLVAELKEWERLMRLREYWEGENEGTYREDLDADSKFKTSKWVPPKGRDPWLDLYLEEVSSSIIRGLKKKGRSNISKSESEALLSLMKDDSIVIRPADKGSSFVILDKEDYVSRLSEEVEKGVCYGKTPGDITSSVIRKVSKLATRLEENGYIGKCQRTYLIPPRPTPGVLQGNPKLHKEGAPMRAIVSGRGQATERMAELAEQHLNEHVESQESYVKDTSDFLTKLLEVSQPVEGREGHKPLLFCMDVSKLYPSVPRREAIDACRQALDTRTAAGIPTEELINIIELVLDNNNFQLGDKRNYIQTDGTAIGSRLGRNFACTYMGAWEKELLGRATHKPLKWFRFIDDIWGIWTHGEGNLRAFHALANQIHPNIKVDLRLSDSCIEFLDIQILLSNSGFITTDLFIKPTDARAYLHYTSDHPLSTKRAIPKGLGMRIKRICSNDKDYSYHKDKLISRLSERGYPKRQITNELDKVDRMKREDLLLRRDKKSGMRGEGRVPMVVTFSSFLPDIRAIMRKNRHILNKSDKLKRIFPKDPLVAFKRGSSLRDILVHSKTRRALVTHGRQDCGGKCVICKVFFDGETVPGKEGPLHYDRTIGCKTSNLVYGIWCVKCDKVVYVGQTGDTIYKRTQNHLSSIRCSREGRIPVSRHFSGEGHSENDFRVVGLERTWGNSEERRKFREMRWIALLGTQKESDGENVRREG